MAFLLAAAALVAEPTAAERYETVLVSSGTPGVAAAYSGAQASGERVFIATAAALAPDDTDANGDLYELRGAATTLVSVAEPGAGGAGGGAARFRAISPDGSRIVFTTNEQLVAEDTDPFDDIYARAEGHTQLLSGGGTDFFGSPLFWGGASDDAGRVFFTTQESLTPADDDFANDVYGWVDGAPVLVSVDAAGTNFPAAAEYLGASRDGSRVFFGTTAAVTAADTDAGRDVYERSGGSTSLVTTAGTQDVLFQAASSDWSHVFFESFERIAATDTDDQKDVYAVVNGQTEHISTGPAGGNGPYRSDFQRASRDGSRVYFTTTDHLVSADTDDADDIFQRHAGETTIESHGPVGGDSGDAITLEQTNRAGTRMYFRTAEQLTADDQDLAVDSYVRTEGRTERITIGEANDNDSAVDAGFAAATEGGERMFFTSLYALTSDDDDTRDDIFERTSGGTRLVSTGPALATSPTRADAVFEAISEDGTRLWFTTTERLTADDEDDTVDVYESRVIADPPSGPAPSPDPAPPLSPGPADRPTLPARPGVRSLGLVSALGPKVSERGGVMIVPCRATRGLMRHCTARVELAGRAARGGHVIGRGAARLPGRGRRFALVRVRLTPRGIALVRRAGGSHPVVVRLRARGARDRSGAVTRRTRLALPRTFSIDGFGVGMARVPPSRGPAIRAMIRDLAGARSVRCVGHSDGSATPAFAERLALLRATAVCRLLAARGIQAALTPASAGSRLPVATNRTREGRARNRRVTVRIVD